MKALNVTTQNYVHRSESGDTPTYAYAANEIEQAVETFLADAVQVTPCFCESPHVPNARFMYKLNAQ